MLDKLRLRNQRQPAPKEPDRGPSNSLPICWDFPLGRKKLEAFINRTVSQRDKIAMERVSDELQESQAEAMLYKLGLQSAMEALRHEKKERKKENREQRTQKKAAAKVQKKQEARQKRDDRAVAKAAWKVAEALKKAQRTA